MSVSIRGYAVARRLQASGVISAAQLEAAANAAHASGASVLSTLVEGGFVGERDLTDALALIFGIEAVDLDAVDIDAEQWRLVPAELAVRHLVVPLGLQGSTLRIAIADPMDLMAIDDLRLATRFDLHVVLAGSGAIRRAFERSGMAEGRESSAFHQLDVDPGVDEEPLGSVREPAATVWFTCGHPAEIGPATAHHLLLFAHPLELFGEAHRRLQRAMEGETSSPATASQPSASTVPLGSVLRVEPRVRGARCTPRAIEIEWQNQVQEARFEIRAEPGAAIEQLLGSIDVSLAGLVIASVPVSIRVRVTPLVAAQTPRARLLQSLFCSYAHEDAGIVNLCAEVYRRLGIDVLVDSRTLRSGDTFAVELDRMIQSADVFQLYWSPGARDSEWVRKEWTRALALSGPAGAKGESFLRPLYWADPMAEPPDPIAHLHFDRLDTQALRLVASRGS